MTLLMLNLLLMVLGPFVVVGALALPVIPQLPGRPARRAAGRAFGLAVLA